MTRLTALVALVLLAALTGCGSRHEPHPTKGHSQEKSLAIGHADGGSGHAHAGHGGQAGGTLLVSTRPPAPQAGQPATIRLMIHEADGTMVKAFDVVHEKKLHLIVVREGLDRFAHLHPELDAAGNATTTFTFPAGGTYWLYADHKPAGKPQATLKAEVKVGGDAPPPPALKPDVPGKVKGEGLLADVAVKAGPAAGATRIAFRLTDPSGGAVQDLQPYLGAMGHLTVLSADGGEFVHAHPADEKAAGGTVAFDAHFTRPGVYKGWGQFQRAGQVHTVSFVVRVPKGSGPGDHQEHPSR